MSIGLTTYRVHDASLGCWWQVDPKAEAMRGLSPYNAMGNNPVTYSDPEGDLPHILAGAIIGGVLNIGLQAWNGNINSLGDLGMAAAIGAGAGALGAATGGASLALTGTGTTLAGAVGAGALSGASGGAIAGLVQNTGNAMYFGDMNFGDAISGPGLSGALYGGLFGGVLGGITGGIGYQIRNGKPGNPNKPTIADDAVDPEVVNATVKTGRQAVRFPDGKVYIDGPDGWVQYKPSSNIVNTTVKQLQKKFKHAVDFGIKGNYSKANGLQFNSAINQHINSPGVRAIQGTYRGSPVTHYVNPSSGLNVIVGPNNQFISGWQLGADQLMNVLKHGGLN